MYKRFDTPVLNEDAPPGTDAARIDPRRKEAFGRPAGGPRPLRQTLNPQPETLNPEIQILSRRP